MDISTINFVAVLVAAIAAFLIGAVFYTAFSKPWMRAAKIEPASNKTPFPILLITSFVAELIMALVMSILIGATTFGEFGLQPGLFWGFLVWLGFGLMTMVVNHRYEGFGLSLTLIDGLHWLLVMLAIGGIIGWFGAPAMVL